MSTEKTKTYGRLNKLNTNRQSKKRVDRSGGKEKRANKSRVKLLLEIDNTNNIGVNGYSIRTECIYQGSPLNLTNPDRLLINDTLTTYIKVSHILPNRVLNIYP